MGRKGRKKLKNSCFILLRMSFAATFVSKCKAEIEDI